MQTTNVTDNLSFDYYYGAQPESEQSAFYKLPKCLIKDSRYHVLSNEAKVLYTLMLDRMSLSRHNKWLDAQNRVYICYSINDVCHDLAISKNTATSVLRELDTQHGIGLIERIKHGQGKPSIIYVKHLVSSGEKTSYGIDVQKVERQQAISQHNLSEGATKQLTTINPPTSSISGSQSTG